MLYKTILLLRTIKEFDGLLLTVGKFIWINPDTPAQLETPPVIVACKFIIHTPGLIVNGGLKLVLTPLVMVCE
jgi:hypothetical protein